MARSMATAVFPAKLTLTKPLTVFVFDDKWCINGYSSQTIQVFEALNHTLNRKQALMNFLQD
ncbi:hypothetical protein [Marinobacter salarius]